MSAPAQDGQPQAPSTNPLRQKINELRQNQKYKTLILPEQVTLQYFPFLAEATLKQYQTGMSNLWQAMATKPESDPQHQQALTKCQHFSQNLIKQLGTHRQTQGAQQANGQAAAAAAATSQTSAAAQANQAAQTRAPSQPPAAQQAQQQAQNQQQGGAQTSQDQAQQPTQQPMQPPLQSSDQQHMELPAELKQRVENMHFEAPNNLQGDAAAQWRAEAQKRYSRALLDQYKAKSNIIRAEQMIQTAHSKGQEVPASVMEIKGKEEEKYRQGQQLIDNLTRGQNANKMPAAQAAARVMQQTNAQLQVGNVDGMQNRPASQGQTAMNPAITAAQQQMRTSMTPPIPGQQHQQIGSAAAHLGQPNAFGHPQQQFNIQRPQPNPTQATQMKYPTPGSLTNQSPVPLTHQAAVAAAARSHSQVTPSGIPQLTSTGSFTQSMDSKGTNNKYQSSFNKNWQPQTTPQPANMQATARPTLTGLNSGPMGVMGQPAIQKQPPFLLQGQGDRVLDKKKLDELVRQVTGGSGEGLQPEVEEVRPTFPQPLLLYPFIPTNTNPPSPSSPFSNSQTNSSTT